MESVRSPRTRAKPGEGDLAKQLKAERLAKKKAKAEKEVPNED